MELADRLAVVVEECISNLIEHADLAAGARIGLTLTADVDGVRVSVSDPGAPFDPRAWTFEGPNPERGGGAGLALIRAWSEIESYRRRSGRNVLVLRVRPGATTADLAPHVG